MKNLREQLLNLATKPVIEPLELPELGGKVYVKGSTIAERTKFEQKFVNKDDKDADGVLELFVETVICSVCDEKGVLMFNADDAEALANLPSVVIHKIVKLANKINGLDAKALEDAQKN